MHNYIHIIIEVSKYTYIYTHIIKLGVFPNLKSDYMHK